MQQLSDRLGKGSSYNCVVPFRNCVVQTRLPSSSTCTQGVFEQLEQLGAAIYVIDVKRSRKKISKVDPHSLEQFKQCWCSGSLIQGAAISRGVVSFSEKLPGNSCKPEINPTGGSQAQRDIILASGVEHSSYRQFSGAYLRARCVSQRLHKLANRTEGLRKAVL